MNLSILLGGTLKTKILTITATLLLSVNTWAFMNPMGMMKGMMGMPMQAGMMGMRMMGMDPMQMMLNMCKSGMGQMGAGMMNMFGMEGTMIGEMEKMIMGRPDQVLQALDCAKKNYNLTQLMIRAIDKNPALLHELGGAMVLEGRIALSMLDLASQPNGRQRNPIAELLFKKMDPLLFSQLTYAMIQYPEMVMPVMRLVRRHQDLAFDFNGALMQSLIYWQNPDNSKDGTEAAFERFVYIVMYQVESANFYMEMLEELSEDKKIALLNIMFLGVNYHLVREEYQLKWQMVAHEGQSHRNIYAMIDGLYHAIIGEVQGPIGLDSVTPEGQELMANMMKYMVDEKLKPTEWGKHFLQTLIDGAYVHSHNHGDPHRYYNETPQKMLMVLGEMMKEAPGFKKSMPSPNPESPGPRRYFKDFPPIVPQTRVRGL